MTGQWRGDPSAALLYKEVVRQANTNSSIEGNVGKADS